MDLIIIILLLLLLLLLLILFLDEAPHPWTCEHDQAVALVLEPVSTVERQYDVPYGAKL